MTLEEAKKNVGQTVIYNPGPSSREEVGRIVRVNDHYAFVLYENDYTPKATPISNLRIPQIRKL